MSAFLNDNFLLNTETARKLYFESAASLPIIDYHCHVSPKEIYEDKRFENITEVWLSGDHYKWRLMRSNGVDEYYITGDADPYEKFLKFAELMPKAIGNPMYHWCHLELKNYFGYSGVLCADTAKEVWDICAEKLKEENMSVRGIIKQSNVVFIGTTDDPVDSLEYHKLLASDSSMTATVAPSFRPDKALNIHKTGWIDYIAQLSEVSGIRIDSVDSLKNALSQRMSYFAEHGCRAADHGLDYVMYCPADERTVQDIFDKAMSGKHLKPVEQEIFMTDILLHCGREYARLGWVMQIHFSCQRNPNTRRFAILGPDSGFDSMAVTNSCASLYSLMDEWECEGHLPKTILYSLNPADNAWIDTLCGAFQDESCQGKIQHGSAWWFNDHKQGMRDQLISLANLSLLGNFVGMLTDSRSFLSYTRHEYFRRILCALIGEWVENGEYPSDEKTLQTLVSDICYGNAKRYFGL